MSTETSMQRLAAFIATRDARQDWSLFVNSDRTRLHLSKLSAVAGISRSAIYQNQVVKHRLAVLEGLLRGRGILEIEGTPGAAMYGEVDASVTEQDLQDLSMRLASVKDSLRDAEKLLADYQDQIDSIKSGDEFK
jgi:hypothetical protein